MSDEDRIFVELVELTKEEIESIDYKTAQILCKENDIKANGSLADLVTRLLSARFGKSKNFQPGMTKCSFCEFKVAVRRTKKFRTPAGKLAITRYLRCQGPRGHTYPLTELVDINEE